MTGRFLFRTALASLTLIVLATSAWAEAQASSAAPTRGYEVVLDPPTGPARARLTPDPPENLRPCAPAFEPCRLREATLARRGRWTSMRHEQTIIYEKCIALMETAREAIESFPPGFGFLAALEVLALSHRGFGFQRQERKVQELRGQSSAIRTSARLRADHGRRYRRPK